MTIEHNNIIKRYGFDNSNNSFLFSARMRSSIPEGKAKEHLSLIQDMDLNKKNIVDKLSSSIEKVNNQVWKVKIDQIDSIGLLSYLSELGRGITKPNLKIRSGFFYNDIDNFPISGQDLYISTGLVDKDMVVNLIAYNIGEEIISTVKSLESQFEIQKMAEKAATNIILEIPYGEKLMNKAGKDVSLGLNQ